MTEADEDGFWLEKMLAELWDWQNGKHSSETVPALLIAAAKIAATKVENQEEDLNDMVNMLTVAFNEECERSE